MAITINSEPSAYASLHEPLWFVVSSTNTAQTNFKYVCDVYVAGNLIARLKSFPQPSSTKGIFNVSSIIRNYWESYFKPNTTPTAFAYTGSDIYVNFLCKFGEEYNGTTYTNLEETDNFAYNYIGDYLDSRMDFNKFTYLDSSVYNSYYKGYYLTNRDRSEVTFDLNRFSTARHYVGYLAESANTNHVHYLSVDVINPSGTSTYTGANVTFKDFALLDLSPVAINTYLGTSAITTNTKAYNVSIFSDTVDRDGYYVKLVCQPRYDSISLHFLNFVGGYDTMLFSLVNRQSRTVERKSFERLEWEYEAAGTNMDRVDQYNRFYGGTIPFATRQQVTLKLTSDLINYKDYNWLKELIASPEVYLESDGKYIPVTITSSNWTEKKKYADKTFNLELDIQLANKINSQFR